MKYVCPTDEDQVLFEESGDYSMQMVVPLRPKQCPKCLKYFYREDCKAKP